MGFKELPAAERLRILRSEGGYRGWLREQARARAGDKPAVPDASASAVIEVVCRVPAAAAPTVTRLADALRDGDLDMVRQGCDALLRWASGPGALSGRD